MTHPHFKKIVMFSCVSIVFGGVEGLHASAVVDEAKENESPLSMHASSAMMNEERGSAEVAAIPSTMSLVQETQGAVKPKRSLLGKVVRAPVKAVSYALTPVWWLFGSSVSAPAPSTPQAAEQSDSSYAPTAHESISTTVSSVPASTENSVEAEAASENPLAQSINTTAMNLVLEEFGQRTFTAEEFMEKLGNYKRSLKSAQREKELEEQLRPLFASVFLDGQERQTAEPITGQQLLASIIQPVVGGAENTPVTTENLAASMMQLVVYQGPIAPQIEAQQGQDEADARTEKDEEEPRRVESSLASAPTPEFDDHMAYEMPVMSGNLVMGFLNFLVPGFREGFAGWSGDY